MAFQILPPIFPTLLCAPHDCLKSLLWFTASSFMQPMRSTGRHSEEQSKVGTFSPPASFLRHHHRLSVSFTQGHSSARQLSPHCAASLVPVLLLPLRKPSLPRFLSIALYFLVSLHTVHRCVNCLFIRPSSNFTIWVYHLFPTWALLIYNSSLMDCGPGVNRVSNFQLKR